MSATSAFFQFSGQTERASEDAFELPIDSDLVRIVVKRVATARRFTLRVRQASRDVVLTMPKRASAKEAKAFAQRHAAWAAARLARLPKAVVFRPDTVIPYRGAGHRLVHRETASRLPKVEEIGEERSIVAGGEGAFFGRRIEDFLRREARRCLEAAVADYCAKIAAPAAPITLRDTTSRWGSCTVNGRLNFSWRLILAPAFVLDYLAAHEVAHLRHLNHSASFWRLLRGLCPSTELAEAWLKAHGADLHRYVGE